MISKELSSIMIFCLLATIIIEVTISFILKVRNKNDYINIVLVNIITNPLLVSITTFILYRFGLTWRRFSVIIFEIIVVFVEGYIYKKYINYNKIKPYMLSLILNVSSYLIGNVISNFF